MHKSFIIKLINPNGQKGYVCKNKKGVFISIDSVNTSIIQFESDKEAKTFIKENRLERGKTKAYVKSNEELLTDGKIEGITQLKDTKYYIGDDYGRKVYFDIPSWGYYLNQGNIGYCCWNTKAEAEACLIEFNKNAVLMPQDNLCVKQISAKDVN